MVRAEPLETSAKRFRHSGIRTNPETLRYPAAWTLQKHLQLFWTKKHLGDWDLGTAGYRIFVLKGPFVEIKLAIKSLTTL